MKLLFIDVLTAHESWILEAQDLYRKKISHFHPLEMKTLSTKKNAREDSERKRIQDTSVIENEISKDDWVILFDEKGKKLSSIEFSKEVQKVLNSGKKRLVFVVGGAYGVTDEFRQKSQSVVNLSPLTLNHAVAKIVGLEQIYRAFTLLKGIPYHNE